MKKLLSIVILSALLLGLVGVGTASAADITCAEVTAGAGTWTCEGTTHTCSATQGQCDAIVVGGGSSITGLKEYCTLSNNMVWKSGTIGSDDCTATPFCELKADETVGPPTSGETHRTAQWGMICLINSINSVTNWIFYLLMVFVVVMVVVGGATYMLASGDPEKAGKGKSIIIYGVVGLVIALLARLIPSVVKLIVGM